MKTKLEKIFDAFHTGDYTHILDYVHFRTYIHEEYIKPLDPELIKFLNNNF